jgi:hypothetical protein
LTTFLGLHKPFKYIVRKARKDIKMKTLTFLFALTAFSASAAEVYLNDGTVIDLPVGSKLYVEENTVWTFTRFNEGGFDLRPLTPVVEITEVCLDNSLTFGGGSIDCEEEIIVEEEECDSFTFGGSGGC